MRKIIIVVAILAVLAAVGVAGAGWIIGGKAEAGYRQALDEVGVQVPGLSLENETYDRGVFSSRARTAVYLENEKVLFEHRISHPPRTSVRVETRLVAGEDLTAEMPGTALLAAFRETPVVTEIDFSGHSRSRFALEGFEHDLDSGQGGTFVVQSDGLEMVVDLAADLRSGQGRFDMPSLRFSGDGIVLEVAGASSRFSSSEERGLTVGQYHTTLESFRFELDREPKYASVALKGLDMASRNGITGGFYGGMVQLQADRMRLGEADYGPLEIKMEVEHLPVEPLQRFQQEIEKLNRADALEPQEAQMRFLMALGEIVPQILGDQPRLVLKKLSMNGPQGDLSGTGIITVAEGAAPAGLQQQLASLVGNLDISLQRDLLHSLIMAVQYLKAERCAGVDEQLDGQITQAASATIEQLKAQNILTENDDLLSLSLHLEKLQLTLNGKTVQL